MVLQRAFCSGDVLIAGDLSAAGTPPLQRSDPQPAEAFGSVTISMFSSRGVPFLLLGIFALSLQLQNVPLDGHVDVVHVPVGQVGTNNVLVRSSWRSNEEPIAPGQKTP